MHETSNRLRATTTVASRLYIASRTNDVTCGCDSLPSVLQPTWTRVGPFVKLLRLHLLRSDSHINQSPASLVLSPIPPYNTDDNDNQEIITILAAACAVKLKNLPIPPSPVNMINALSPVNTSEKQTLFMSMHIYRGN
jgi:hypothetical protein